MSHKRTALHNQVVGALIESKAIDFDRVGEVVAKFGKESALTGDSIGVIINWRVMDLCIPVDFYDLVRGINIPRNIQTNG